MSANSFSFETNPADTSFYDPAPLTVTQANNSGGSIVGSVKNATGHKISGPYEVEVYCFSSGNKLLSEQGGFTDQDRDQAPGATLTFSVDLYGASCPRFVVGSSGYFQQ